MKRRDVAVFNLEEGWWEPTATFPPGTSVEEALLTTYARFEHRNWNPDTYEQYRHLIKREGYSTTIGGRYFVADTDAPIAQGDLDLTEMVVYEPEMEEVLIQPSLRYVGSALMIIPVGDASVDALMNALLQFQWDTEPQERDRYGGVIIHHHVHPDYDADGWTPTDGSPTHFFIGRENERGD